MKYRIIAGATSALLAINIITMLPANAFALGSESRTYEKDGYTVTYRIGEEWDSNRSVEVTIENTGEESILNWALRYDVGGEVYNLWNSSVYDSTEEYSIIKNNGYNYEIEPGESANYGYIVRGDETVIPEDIELCSRRIDVRSGYDVDFTVTDDWNTGFTASVTLTNTSAEPIEAWTLLFDGNFDIKDIWGAKLLSSEERSYETAAEQWTNPIASGSSITFGFTADKSATENANAENFALTAVIVGESSLVYPDFTDEDIDYELDTDSDNLPDYYEDILGTDKDKADTDGDGLTDGDEVFFIGTDPLKADSDDNGINDGEEDPDSDGLTNAKECEIGTSPVIADSDMDSLTDGDEVNTHNTDPLKYDSDEDSISDGDEITLGLDPNSGSTNGTPDSERTFTQVVSADSEALSAINDDEETPFDVSLEIKAAGVAENNVYARESGYSNAIENTAIVGAAPEFVYTDGLAVEEVTVKFELENSVINNTLGTYAENNDGFKGIKRLNVFMFIEDVNMLLPIETNYDEANNIVSATTNRVGTYCLMDMELFFDNLGIAPSASETADVEVSEAMSKNDVDTFEYKCYTVNECKAKSNSKKYKDNFDISFIVDEINNDSSDIEEIKVKIRETSKAIWKLSPSVNVSIFGLNGRISNDNACYGSATDIDSLNTVLENLTAKPWLIEAELSKAVGHMKSAHNVNKNEYCFIFYDAENAVYKNPEGKAVIQKIKSEGGGITISVISNTPEGADITTYAQMLHNETEGCSWGEGMDRKEFLENVLTLIYGEVPEEDVYLYNVIIATGYETVVLNKALTPNDMALAEKLYDDPNYIFSESELAECEDTDGDGLYDFEEVMFYSDFVEDNVFVSFKNGKIELPQVADIMRMLINNDMYAFVGQGKDKAHEEYGNCWAIFLTYPVLPIYSDPTSEDGDSDGEPDNLEFKYQHNPLVIDSVFILRSNKTDDQIKAYVDEISNVVGCKKTLEYIMNDYYNTENDIGAENISDKRWNKYCCIVNEYVINAYPIGTSSEEGLPQSLCPISAEVHYFRNNLNRAPATLGDMINEFKKGKWKLLSVDESVFHMYGDGGEYNVKFVSTDEYEMFEAVYSCKHDDYFESPLIDYKSDIHSCATYNYTGPKDWLAHAFYDVIPYYLYYSVPDVHNPYLEDLTAIGFLIDHSLCGVLMYAYFDCICGDLPKFWAEENINKYDQNDEAQIKRDELIEQLRENNGNTSESC